MEILGVRVDQVTKDQALAAARNFLNGEKCTLFFTPNPEMVVKAQTDSYFRIVLNSGDVNLCDGKGLQLAGRERLERIPGVDFMIELCQVAEETGKNIFLLGSGSDEVLDKTKAELLRQFPKLRIVGVDRGPVIKEQRLVTNNLTIHRFSNERLLIDPGEQANLLNKIRAAKADILFVAFGMGKQEKWLYENRTNLAGIKIGMGVGGALDFISGQVPRAPLLMRGLGLEWLYRLWREPSRISRIGNATITFLYYLIKG